MEDPMNRLVRSLFGLVVLAMLAARSASAAFDNPSGPIR
jgi:hypothetical protein